VVEEDAGFVLVPVVGRMAHRRRPVVGLAVIGDGRRFGGGRGWDDDDGGGRILPLVHLPQQSLRLAHKTHIYIKRFKVCRRRRRRRRPSSSSSSVRTY
jgi:hypothetical protein